MVANGSPESGALGASLRDALTGVPITLSLGQTDAIGRLLDLLREWNQRMHLTAVVDPGEMVVRHALDSLLLLAVAKPPQSVVDVGCGNGFPGLALAIAWPEATVHLVDSSRKSCVFLQEARRELGTENVTIRHGRAEEAVVRKGVGGVELVVTRGFTPRAYVGQCLPAFVEEGGAAIVYSGRAGMAAEVRRDFADGGLRYHGHASVSAARSGWVRRFDVFSGMARPAVWMPEEELECFT